jgi:5'-3' exoribonuclease 1
MKIGYNNNQYQTKMGIKHFFRWFRNQFADNIEVMRHGVTYADLGIEVDNFMIDLNGIFHGSAQKVYEYGEFKPLRRLMRHGRVNRDRGGLKKQLAAFKDICLRIEYLKNIVNPRKRLILCIDGPAPLSKQAQQRQRRFRSANEKDETDAKGFDGNSITPGTKWMDHLSKYIDWYVRKRMSEDSSWANIEVIFSNEKCPGEGEHKIINYIRLYGDPDESYCIHGADADLIMLSLGTHYPHFFILRDDLMGRNDFFAIDIGGVRQGMGDLLYWPGKKYDPKSAINDFILMCFMVGNDFLPHIPGIAIIHGSIDQMIDVYKTVAEEYGHLTKYTKRDDIRFSKTSLKAFIGTLSQYEKGAFQEKLAKRDNFFPSPILENNATQDDDGKWVVDIEAYRQEYYDECLPEVKDMEDLCFEYLEGMQWVLSYYTRGVPNWKWRYPYHYAPFCHTLAEHIDSFNFPVYGHTKPTTPFIQLLSVLPPKSSKLIPRPLDRLLTDKKSVLHEFCPEDFEVDLSGCRQKWEGTVLLPMIDYSLVESQVLRLIAKVDSRDTRRNILGKSFIYVKSEQPYHFRSYYGDLRCNVQTKVIEGI